MIIDLWHDERIDESERLGFEIPIDDPKAYLLAVDYEIRWRSRRFFVAEIEDRRDGNEVRKSVRCNALWYRLADPTFVGSIVLDGLTVAAGLEEILSGTDWTVGAQTVGALTTFSMEKQDLTKLALVREWAKVTQTAVVWNTDERSVDLVTDRGADRGVGFRYRRNLRTVLRRIRPPEATVLYGYGASGLNVAGVNGGEEFVEDFTFYTDQGIDITTARERFTRSRVWSDGSFLRDTDLLAAMVARLATMSSATITYEIGVVDLSELTGISEVVNIADTVRVFDEDLGVDLSTSVVRRKQYPLQPWRDEIELGKLPDVLASTDGAGRPQASNEWTMFVADSRAEFQIRNDGRFSVNRLPLKFREGGQAHYHLDFFGTGVGAGDLIAEVYDSSHAATVYRELRIPYVDGEVFHGTLQWAETDLSGQYDYRVRMRTEASGGPDPTKGIDVLLGESRFFILAIGAVQQTPPAGNTSLRYDYTGAVQTFTVPDDVTELTIEVVAASGGLGTLFQQGRALGGSVTAKFEVTPGDVFDVYVGGQPTDGANAGGWPAGGSGDLVAGANGSGGGGRSEVRPNGLAITDALLVAGAGGGAGEQSATFGQCGGDGGFWVASDGALAPASDGGLYPGAGGTGTAGGAGGIGTFATGAAGSQGAGGNAADATNGFAQPPGGGGDGFFGGGGGGTSNGAGLDGGGGGGGGSGHADEDAFDLEIADGVNEGDGYVVFTWTDPDA